MQETGSGHEKEKDSLGRTSPQVLATSSIGVWTVHHLEPNKCYNVNPQNPATNECYRTSPPPRLAASSLPPIFATPSAEVERAVLRASQPTERRVNSQGTIGNSSGAPCPPPPPLPTEARNRAQEGPVLNRGPTGSPGEAVRRPGHTIAFPVAMRESDHSSPAGRHAGSAQQQQSDFYFNLGRRMMLDSIE